MLERGDLHPGAQCTVLEVYSSGTWLCDMRYMRSPTLSVALEQVPDMAGQEPSSTRTDGQGRGCSGS